MSNLRNCSAYVLKQSVSNILNSMGTNGPNSRLNVSVRTFSKTRHLAKSKNLYDDLEIPKTATQTEVKSAYYELSKAYHPDRNKSEQAKLKFRLITEAYEILGNVRTRRMYDKGIGSFGGKSTGTSSSNESEILYEETEDDAQTKFYKQHMVKSQPPDMADRVSAREIDSYAAELTTKSFHQMQRARKAQRDKQEDMELHKANSRAYAISMTVVCAIVCIMLIIQMIYDRAHNAELRRIKLLNEKRS